MGPTELPHKHWFVVQLSKVHVNIVAGKLVCGRNHDPVASTFVFAAISHDWSDSRSSIKSIFLDVENNSKNVETKFHGRRISVYEVIKSINVNFLLF